MGDEMTMRRSVDAIRKVIVRLPIPPGQITLFKALYEHPDGLSRNELARIIRDGEEKSLTGVLGALGLRVNKTPGIGDSKPGLRLFLETDGTRDRLVYRLWPETREAIKMVPPLRKAMALTVDEIFDRFDSQDDSRWLRPL